MRHSSNIRTRAVWNEFDLIYCNVTSSNVTLSYVIKENIIRDKLFYRALRVATAKSAVQLLFNLQKLFPFLISTLALCK